MFASTCRAWPSTSVASILPDDRIDRNLAGAEEEIAGANGLRIGADGGGGVGCGDDLHECRFARSWFLVSGYRAAVLRRRGRPRCRTRFPFRAADPSSCARR